MSKLENLTILPDQPMREAMRCIDGNGRGIVMVVDVEQRLLGTLTDGDMRRAILAGIELDAAAAELLAHKLELGQAGPITAPVNTPHADLMQLMQQNSIRQIPLIDEEGRVVDLVTLDQLLPDEVLPLEAVIMAGGQGLRLRPLTDKIPKPMLPVGDRPLMELILEQLKVSGIRHVTVTTHYLAEKITSYFGDGRDFGVEMSYVPEDRPLGTAGALGLLEAPNEPTLVMNGDILTKVDFRAMLEYHRENQAALTVAVRQYDLQVPYGVIECNGAQVRQIREKPVLKFLASAGIYLLEPWVYKYIPGGERFDMPELIQRLLNEGHKVVSFPILEYWLDIGQHADYQRAQDDVKNGRLSS